MHKKLTITILLIIALAGVGVVVQQVIAPAKDRPGKEPSGVTDSPLTSVPSEIDTSNWQNFQSLAFGYSFKYPASWNIPDFEPNASTGVSVSNPKMRARILIEVLPSKKRVNTELTRGLSLSLNRGATASRHDLNSSLRVIELSYPDSDFRRAVILNRNDLAKGLLIFAYPPKQKKYVPEFFSVYRGLIHTIKMHSTR